MTRSLLLVLFVLSIGVKAFAQDTRFDAGAHVTIAQSSELDATDTGVSGRVAWFPAPAIGVEAEVGGSPADIPDRVAISSSRLEGLFGITAGPRLGRLRPFLKVRPGFLRLAAAPEPVACIAIFPPPLSCTLAGGRTLFVTDLGGGITVDATARSFIRFDVGDRLVRYPGPAFTRDRDVHDEAFFDHDLRFAVGAGWRF